MWLLSLSLMNLRCIHTAHASAFTVFSSVVDLLSDVGYLLLFSVFTVSFYYSVYYYHAINIGYESLCG